MEHYLCVTCGTQYPASDEPPATCAICEDPRQYVPVDGQKWTTLDELRESHRAEIRDEATGAWVPELQVLGGDMAGVRVQACGREWVL